MLSRKTLPFSGLRLPIIASPMFIISSPEMVVAQCRAGIIGSFPALNAREPGDFEAWVSRITAELAESAEDDPAPAPFAVNHIIHPTSPRLDEDLEVCVRYKVPIVITSLQASAKVVDAIHSYGGTVFHDVVNVRHARKALDVGVDGLIAVCAGAGGHAGRLSPFALVTELRTFYDGPLALSGAIATGDGVLGALAMGADYAYMGTRFIAAEEANASDDYKQGVVDSTADEIVYTNLITGVHANFLRRSIVSAGLDPDNLPQADKSKMNFGSGGNMEKRAWRDIWGAGQSVAGVNRIQPVAEIIDEIEASYRLAWQRLNAIA